VTFTPPITLAFTSGLAIAGAAAMGVPIIIHLFSRFRRKREPWGAMRFLMEAFRKHRRRLQLEQLLLLAVRCLLLLALGFALAGPVLTGCAGQVAGGLDASGRRVYLVLDDALTSRAAAGSDTTRFDELKKTALSLLDAMGPGDRVAVYRAAWPMRPELAAPTLDLDAARRSIQAMQPRYTRADLPGTLAAVQAALVQDNAPSDRAFVVVLSDLSRAAIHDDLLAAGAPAELGTLASRAKLIISPPMVGAANVQIASAIPRRSMVLVESGMPASVPIELQLRRFDLDAPAAMTPVEIAVVNDDGRPIGEPLRRDVRWSGGQTTATLNVELPLLGSSGDGADRPAAAAIMARLTGGATGDALAEDDVRHAVVELRRRITVAIVGEPPAATSPGGGFTPRQWLGLALSPRLSGGNGTVELIDLPPDALNTQQPRTGEPLDAAIVTRPDLLSPEGWAELRRLADAGGLIWVFAPASDNASVWGQAMTTAFELPWQIGLEPVTVEDDATPWMLDVNAPVPEALGLLAADWIDLLRPVRVSKRLEVTLREGQHRTWLALPQGAWLTAADAPGAGEGMVLLLASALDAQWTNLPTKPLFVPLLHETLRSVLGGSIESSRRRAVVTGVSPTLGRRWLGAQELVRVGSAESVALTTTDLGITLASPLDWPGVWQAMPESAGRKLAVNLDADAGDTRAVDPARLAEWLGGLGAWTFLNPNEPAAALLVQREATDIGWPLLWLVMALALLETLLARRFSHAEQAATTGVSAGAAGLLRRAIATLNDKDDAPQRAA
jgi:hypothetical protein